ncbi:MAG: thioredoxin [bacterium]
MTIKHVTDASFQTDVIESEKPILVDYWAVWCGPCKQIAPALEEIDAEMGETITIAKMDIDENPETPGKYGVRGVPTLMIFVQGEIAATSVGVKPKSQLVEWINATLATLKVA